MSGRTCITEQQMTVVTTGIELQASRHSSMLNQILNSKLDSRLRHVFIMGGKKKSIDLMIWACPHKRIPEPQHRIVGDYSDLYLYIKGFLVKASLWVILSLEKSCTIHSHFTGLIEEVQVFKLHAALPEKIMLYILHNLNHNSSFQPKESSE